MQSGENSDELVLAPLELTDRIAQLVPPPRTHRHRYCGVLAPNSPLRAAVTAMAMAPACSPATEDGNANADANADTPGAAVALGGSVGAVPPEPQAKPKPRPPSHYLWAALVARIYEVFPLICPMCGGKMRIIAFITFTADIQKILEHIGVEPEAPRITPARGPPRWEGEGARETGEGVEDLPDWDMTDQPAPDCPDDPRTTW